MIFRSQLRLAFPIGGRNPKVGPWKMKPDILICLRLARYDHFLRGQSQQFPLVVVTRPRIYRPHLDLLPLLESQGIVLVDVAFWVAEPGLGDVSDGVDALQPCWLGSR